MAGVTALLLVVIVFVTRIGRADVLRGQLQDELNRLHHDRLSTLEREVYRGDRGGF